MTISLENLYNISTLQASVEICKYKPAGVSAVYVRKLRRKRLFSFVIYSYVTEIVVLPSFVASCVLVICASIRCQCQINATVFYSVMNVIIRIFYEQSLSITKVQPINAVNVDNINNIAMFVHSNIAMLKTKNVSE
uniref:Uncharacterized protein n=1 Tax=Wuchereria bancrofti TaxID=6293 RepID=A0AAF5Q4F6_WUCBA